MDTPDPDDTQRQTPEDTRRLTRQPEPLRLDPLNLRRTERIGRFARCFLFGVVVSAAVAGIVSSPTWQTRVLAVASIVAFLYWLIGSARDGSPQRVLRLALWHALLFAYTVARDLGTNPTPPGPLLNALIFIGLLLFDVALYRTVQKRERALADYARYARILELRPRKRRLPPGDIH